LDTGADAPGFYLYPVIGGRVASLPAGAAQAPLLPAGNCLVDRVGHVEQLSSAFAGWLFVQLGGTCGGVDTTRWRLINPAKGIATMEGLRFYEGAHSLFLFADDGIGHSQLVQVDPQTGAATPIPGTEGIGFAGAEGPEFFTADHRTVWIAGGRQGFVAVDLVADTVQFQQTGNVPVTPIHARPDGPASGLLFATAVVRLDLGKTVPLCSGVNVAAEIARSPTDADAPWGVFCNMGATLIAYDWASDTVTTLTTAAEGFIRPEGNAVAWTEGGVTRLARIGGNSPGATPCPGQPAALRAFSPDSSAAVASCVDAAGVTTGVVVDLATGAATPALPTPAGVTLSIRTLASSQHGRIASFAYSTTAAAPDPVACAGTVCTWLFDRVSGQGAPAPVPATIVPQVRLQVGPADDAAAVVTTDAGLILVVAGSGPPRAALLGGALRRIHDVDGARVLIGDDLGSTIVDVATGQTTPLGLNFRDLNRMGSSHDYLVAQGIFHFATAQLEPFASVPTFLCSGGDSVTWIEAGGASLLFPVPLRRYGPGSGFQTVAAGAIIDFPWICPTKQTRAFVDLNANASQLVRYDPGTGTLSPLVAGVYPEILRAAPYQFLLQNPDGSGGDLVLFDEPAGRVLPLGTRAGFFTPVILSRGRVVASGAGANAGVVVAARIDGSGVDLVGNGNSFFVSPDGSRVIFTGGNALQLEAPGGPVSVDSPAEFIASDDSGEHVLYRVPSGTRAGTWGFALQ
jgi:hypothetical protein